MVYLPTFAIHQLNVGNYTIHGSYGILNSYSAVLIWPPFGESPRHQTCDDR